MLLVMTGTMVLASPAAQGGERPFEGLRAFVVEPENSWGWDSAIFGALEERSFEVAYGTLPEFPALASYDLVALSIKRNLTVAEAANLTRYVSQGGAVYGSWGGPFGTPRFLGKVCKVAGVKSVRLRHMILLKSPPTRGIPEGKISFAEHVGHLAVLPGKWPGPAGWEVVTVRAIAGGIPVAKDPAGNVLGVLSQYVNGRTAVLGFGPEREKHFAKRELGPPMLNNLLAWLLEEKLKSGRRTWSNLVTIALPARAQVLKVLVDAQPVSKPRVKEVGSLKKVDVDVARCGKGEEVSIRVLYKPLSKARNVETVIHLPWNTLHAAAASPARLAEYLKSMNTTVCQPLLRSGFGHAWYKGMPQDKHDDKLVKQYRGDFLADLISECHRREIKLVAGIYLDNATPVRKYPDVKRLDRKGREAKDRYGRALACFNNPRGREHNLATIEHLLTNYKVDGLILDDNFELDKNNCYCRYCKEMFTRYCKVKGVAYEDPTRSSDRAVARHWRQYQREATRRLAADVRKIAKAHGVPAGGWVGVGMDSTHLAGAFDFLGGMVYATPPRAARGPLSVLGKCGFICLLWAPDASPQTIEREAREAAHAGCATVGFWIRGDDGGYEMDAERSEAIRRAFAGVEKEWLSFYRNNILSGDGRFVIVEGKVAPQALSLRVRNTGEKADRRMRRQIDLSALR